MRVQTRPAVVSVLVALPACMAVLKYLSLHSAVCDLGLLQVNLHRAVAAGEYWRVFWGHFEPAMVAWSALYAALPPGWGVPAMLLLQGLLLFAPCAWILRRHGALPALALWLFFPLWYNALFDFHIDHLAVPLLFAFYAACERERWGLAVLAASSLMLVKEPFMASAFCCGAYLALRHRRLAWGLSLCLISAVVLLVVMRHVIPAVSGGSGYAEATAFSWLGGSIFELPVRLVLDPLLVLGQLIAPQEKLLYVALLLGGFAFIPLLAPLELLPALPLLLVSLLSATPNYYGLGHHYTAGLVAPLCMAFIRGLPRARALAARLGRVPPGAFTALLLLVLTALHVAIAPSPLGRLFWGGKVWGYAASAYRPTRRDAMIRDALARHIPIDQDVTVSSQNTLNWWRLGERASLYPFPLGAAAPTTSPLSGGGNTDPAFADYVILDLTRPWFIADQGCSWRVPSPDAGQEPTPSLPPLAGIRAPAWSSCASAEFKAEFCALVDQALNEFGPVFERDGFVILKRKAEARTPLRD